MHLLYASYITLVKPRLSLCPAFQPWPLPMAPTFPFTGSCFPVHVLQKDSMALVQGGEGCCHPQRWVLSRYRLVWRFKGRLGSTNWVPPWLRVPGTVGAAACWFLCFSCFSKFICLACQYLMQGWFLNRVKWKLLLTLDQGRLECRFSWDRIPLFGADLLAFDQQHHL